MIVGLLTVSSGGVAQASGSADLAVAASAPTTAIAGSTTSQLDYSFTITNAGTDPSDTFTVDVTLPDAASFPSPTVSGDLTCGPVTPGTGDQSVQCTGGALDVADTNGDPHFVVEVKGAAASSVADGTLLSASAALTSTGGTTDPNGGNDSAPAATTVNVQADLGVAVTTAQASATPYSGHDAVAGTDQVFHMTVHNYGPSDNTAYTAVLNVAAFDTAGDFSFVSAPKCASNDNTAHTVTCAGALAAGAATTFDITFHIAPSFVDGSVPDTNRKTTTYSASLSGLAPTDQGTNTQGPDSDPATGTSTLNVDAQADLQITKTAGSNPAIAGTNEVYTISVTNNGPSNNTGYTVTDDIPSGTDFVSAVPQNGTSSCGTPQGVNNTVTCTSPGLAKDAGETFTLTVLVHSNFPEGTNNLSNTSRIATTNTHDPVAGNNVSTVKVSTSQVNVHRVADVGIAVTTTQASATPYAGHDAVAGTDQVFHMTVHNYGPSDNSAYTAVLNVAAFNVAGDFSYVSAPGCGSHDNTAHTVTCSGSLVAGGEKTFDITFHISPNFTDQSVATTNRKDTSYSASLDVPNLNPTDQGANTQGPDADPPTGTKTLHVDAVSDVGVAVTTEQAASPIAGHDAVAGTDQVFHMTVHNYGPSRDTSYTAVLNVAAYDAVGDFTFGSAPGCTANGGGAHTVTCTGQLASGAEKTFDITFSISRSFNDTPSPGVNRKDTTYSASITTATLNPSDQQPNNQGPDADPPTGTKTLHVDAVADVSVVQGGVEQGLTPGTCQPAVGCPFQPTNPGNLNSVIYTVTVSNGGPNGPSKAYSVGLTESLPSTHYQTGSIKYCVGTGCTPTLGYTNTTQIVPLNTIDKGGSSVVRFQVPLKQTDSTGTFPAGVATATATTTSFDPDNPPTPNTGTDNPILYTVPDKPTVFEAQPGNAAIALRWKVPATGGNPILGYDITYDKKVGTSFQNTTLFVPDGDPSLGTVNCGSNTCRTYLLSNLTNASVLLGNGHQHTVTIEARNAAGDSFADCSVGNGRFVSATCNANGSVSATPQATLSTTVFGTQTTTLNSFGTSNVLTDGTKCFPASDSTGAPGATSSRPVVSCLYVPNPSVTTQQQIASLREIASVNADCGNGKCVGDQTSLALLPSGNSVAAEQWVDFDKTITSSTIGDICNKQPCGSKVIYKAYFDPNPNDANPPTLIGTSLMNTWCGAQPPAPSVACIIQYVHVNTATKGPSPDNHNTPNGKEGNGDMILGVRFLVDGTISTCCKK
jgi:uncharacterized repeat protein (TIGR01451 family)